MLNLDILGFKSEVSTDEDSDTPANKHSNKRRRNGKLTSLLSVSISAVSLAVLSAFLFLSIFGHSILNSSMYNLGLNWTFIASTLNL